MADAGPSVYSCRCLNVRIYPAPQQSTPPNNSDDPEFHQCYVGEDGIHVVHPHVTLRTRTRGVPIEGTSQCGRYTTLTCLICEVLAYRVYQTVPIDIEGKEGPLLPTEDWVESEVMKSSTGWIEVCNQCLVNDAVKALESGPEVSALFSVVLPKLQPLSPTFPENPEAADSTASSSPPQPAVSYLEKLKPLFSPAFTPSHPVFRHLANKASAESKILRSDAEEYISRVVKEKRAEVQRAEDELRDQVEAVWFKFKMTVDNIKKERDKPKPSPHPRGNHEMAMPDSPQGPRIAIREFVPVSTPHARISPSEGPRLSALSASLATSSFHHPKANADAQAQAREPNGSVHSQSSNSTADSLTLVRSPSREGASNVLQFRRTNDDALNTAVSFKYFLDLEVEIERKKKERLDEANRKYQAQSEVGPSEATGSPVVNGKKPEDKKPTAHDTVRMKHVQVDTEGSIVEASEKSPAKGKRHVTFDVEPEVVTIKNEANKSKLEPNGEDGQDSPDMIFVLDDAEGEVTEQSPSLEQTLPLLEQPVARPVARHRKTRSLASAGLPSSFLSLRPLSLPGPSHIRPPRSPHGVDASQMSSLPRHTVLDHQKRLVSTLPEASEDELDTRDAVILRLLAADTPSHRGAWKADSPAWKSFTQSHGGKGRNSTEVPEDGVDAGEDYHGTTELDTGDLRELSSEENGDYYHSRAGIPGSLPIPISQLTMKKGPLSLASYQPKTLLSERAAVALAPLVSKHSSTSTLRRASYAERDRKRAMDPGALDFTAEEDEDASQVSEEETETTEDETGTRSRKMALKILQKSSEVPEEGMWRSLAT